MKKFVIRAALFGVCALVIGSVLLGATLNVLADTGLNWSAQYWNNTTESGTPTLTRTDTVINFNWGSGVPDPSLQPHNFSARWTLSQAFGGGAYRFRAGADDGIRVTIDGNVVLDQYHDSASFQVYTTDVNLGAGNHTLQVDYYSKTGLSGVLFDWSGISAIGAAVVTNPTAVPTSAPTMKAVIRVNVANVRGDPSTNNPPLAQVYYGDVYTVLANNGDGVWFLIQLKDGRQGWVYRHNTYLYAGNESLLPTSQAPVTPQPVLANVQAAAIVNLLVRDGPTRRNSKVVGALQRGDTFTVVALSRNHAWVLIKASGGLFGWVFIPYINVTVGDLGLLPIHN